MSFLTKRIKQKIFVIAFHTSHSHSPPCRRTSIIRCVWTNEDRLSMRLSYLDLHLTYKGLEQGSKTLIGMWMESRAYCLFRRLPTQLHTLSRKFSSRCNHCMWWCIEWNEDGESEFAIVVALFVRRHRGYCQWATLTPSPCVFLALPYKVFPTSPSILLSLFPSYRQRLEFFVRCSQLLNT